MTTALVIGRRRPGRPIAEAVHETQQLLEAGGWTIEVAVVKGKKEFRKRVGAAVDAKVDVVVAVGGDGAVLQAVQRVTGTAVALGIVPMGTGNLLATNLEVPRPLPEAVQVLLTGGRRTIDVGRLSIGKKERYFSVACGVGFDAKVMHATAMHEKQRWGKLAYAMRAVTESGKLRDVKHRIKLDGRRATIEVAQILIANLGQSGLGLEPKLPISADDGYLDVIAIRAPGRTSGLLAVWEALRMRSAGKSASGRVLRARAKEIEIEAKSKRLVEIDGSVIGKTPIAVSIRPAALTLIVPATTGSPEPPSG